ncbi:MAG: Rieske 2Fe-2S domain-containing protein [Alphaproteobacteria bacterium]|nr:Rieske 2Fe-2S domain-containing protein [Alphaproteobacteria bacterium]
MQQATQIALTRRILSYLAGKTTHLNDDVYRNPVSDYTCRQQFAKERERFFRRSPLFMGLSCDLPQPGCYLTDDFSGVPMLLVRDDDGRVNGFLNVCRHRGAPVAKGCGKGGKLFVCPYHGWTYDRKGRLTSRPDAPSFAAMDAASHGLRPLPVVERHGMLWAAGAPDAAFDIDRGLAGLQDDLASFALGGYHHYETRVLQQRMNWKLVVDTFLESYHLPFLHSTTVGPIILGNRGAFDGFGHNLRTIYPRSNFESLRQQPEAEWDLVKWSAIVYVLFPNTVFIMQGDHLETWRIYPVGDSPDASRMYVSLYTPEPALTDSAKRHWDRNMKLLMDVVQSEDFPLGEKMQLGFYSGAQPHLTYGRNEPALTHYHRAIKQALAKAA